MLNSTARGDDALSASGGGALIRKEFGNYSSGIQRMLLSKATYSNSYIHTYIHTLMAVAAMQGANQHRIRSSLGPMMLRHPDQGK